LAGDSSACSEAIEEPGFAAEVPSAKPEKRRWNRRKLRERRDTQGACDGRNVSLGVTNPCFGSTPPKFVTSLCLPLCSLHVLLFKGMVLAKVLFGGRAVCAPVLWRANSATPR